MKNFARLKSAYDAASDLYDQEIAGAMQGRILKLKEKFSMTLENEPEVLEIREDYDGLTGKQRSLVDTADLDDPDGVCDRRGRLWHP